MSLLLDARKKSQQAQPAQGVDSGHSERPLGLDPNSASAPTASSARAAGQKLFSAKSQASPLERAGIHRNLLIALGGTVLLLTAGAGYVWYVISPGNLQPPHPIGTPAVAPLAQPAPATTPAPNDLVPGITPAQPANRLAHATPPATLAPRARHHHRTPDIASTKPTNTEPPSRPAQLDEQHQDEPIDLILNNAYLAYRSGHFLQAQQLYHDALQLDERNMDALLGMAATAQRRGADSLAAHYYSQALALDPRNAVANAGMSALSTDDNRISRLKTLLNEQPDSSSLHFALGDRYAEQARWGDAQQAYFNAYQLEPDNAELIFNLAVSLDRLGQKKSAAQYYQRALQLDPDRNAGFDHTQISQRIEALMH